ncbi:hypothetical protein HID58_030972, partial [Brassica napus]
SPKRGEARKRAYKMVEIPRRVDILAAAFDVEAARARLPCDSSSGSDHFPDETADLWDLVESFMDSEVKALPEDIPMEDKDDKSDVDDDYEDVKERLREICENLSGGGERRRIIEEVVNAREFVGEKRLLMAYLRDKGFDAGLCKSKWERFGKNTAGKYEYVDVNRGEKNRFIVETNLAGEFVIAKPTTRYLSLLAQLPRVFVGTPEELKKLVRIMCFEIRRSMKRAEIHVPPWRRNAYMQAKWFGHYKRTSNEVVTRVKSCGCGPRVGFEGLAKTATFNGYKEVERMRQGLKVGQLTVAFTGSGKLYRKGTVHPSPQIKSDDHLLSLLPVAIFSLAAVLSPKDREVLAYLLSTASYSSNRNYTSRMNKTKLHEKSRLDNHAPLFHCDCFSCYTCYWVRWDSSPSRQLIHEIIDAYEDSLEKKKQTKKKKNIGESVQGKSSALASPSFGTNDSESLSQVTESIANGSEEAEEEKGSVRRFVSFIGEKVFGVWGM